MSNVQVEKPEDMQREENKLTSDRSQLAQFPFQGVEA